jgi:hypothetical protein
MPAIQGLQILVTVALAVAGYQLSQTTQASQQAVLRIEADIKQRTEARLLDESQDKTRLLLFEQVSKSIASPDGRQRLAAKALVTTLVPATDPYRAGLLGALELDAPAGVREPLQQAAASERTFLAGEQAKAQEIREAQKTPSKAASPLQGFLVDVFHCTGVPGAEGLLKQAQLIRTRLSEQSLRTRLRPWSESLNASPGYGVRGSQLRHNNDELPVARTLAALLQQQTSLAFTLRPVATPTPNYLSVFVC